MLVSSKEALSRLNSSGNLINQLRESANGRSSAMGLFIPGKKVKEEQTTTTLTNWVPTFVRPVEATAVIIPEVVTNNNPPAKLDDILDNAEAKIKLQQAHNGALDVLVSAVQALKLKMDDIKPEKLPSVIAAASKTVEGIRREKLELNKDRKDRQVHFHFYEPKRRTLADLGEALEV